VSYRRHDWEDTKGEQGRQAQMGDTEFRRCCGCGVEQTRSPTYWYMRRAGRGTWFPETSPKCLGPALQRHDWVVTGGTRYCLECPAEQARRSTGKRLWYPNAGPWCPRTGRDGVADDEVITVEPVEGVVWCGMHGEIHGETPDPNGYGRDCFGVYPECGPRDWSTVYTDDRGEYEGDVVLARRHAPGERGEKEGECRCGAACPCQPCDLPEWEEPRA